MAPVQDVLSKIVRTRTRACSRNYHIEERAEFRAFRHTLRRVVTSTRITLDEFKPGTVYWARLRLLAPRVQEWSAPMSAMAI